MAGERDQRLKEAAAHALRSGKPEDALTAARHLAESLPNDAEVRQIEGLALIQLGEAGAATVALRKAAELDREEPKHPYNLAFHLFQHGQVEEARKAVEEALRRSPGYVDAKNLLDAIDGKVTLKTGFPHLLPWLRGREGTWNQIAYALLAMGIVLGLLMIFRFPAAPTGNAVPKGKMADVALRQDGLSQATVFLYVVSGAATFMWMLADVIDRRKRFTWLVPTTICSVFGLNVIALALYFFVGRRIGEDSASTA